MPVFGYLLDLLNIFPSRSPNALAARLGPVYRSSMGSEVAIIVTTHALCDEVLSDEEVFTSAGAYPAVFEVIFGKRTLIALTGAAHAANRNRLVPAFVPSLFPFYFGPMFTLSKKLWTRAAAISTVDASVSLHPLIRRHFLEVITTITAGVGEEHPSFETAEKLYTELTRGITTVPFGPVWDGAQRAKQQLIDILTSVAEERLRDREDIILTLRAELADRGGFQAKRDGFKADDMLTMFLACTDLRAVPEDSERTEEEALVIFDIAEDLLGLWFAGFETNASLTTCALFEMMRRPEVVSALMEEQDLVWEGLGENGGDVAAQLKAFQGQMPLLASYMEEVNRLKGPSISLNRRALKDSVIGDGQYHIPKNTLVIADTSSAGRDPSVYSNPTELDMRRFLSVPGKPAPKKTFGYGGMKSSHVCIGMALSKLAINITLGTGLREHSLHFVEGQDMSYRTVPFLLPKSGVVARVVPRL